MQNTFRLGIENLISKHANWIKGQNVALLSHAAALDAKGRHTLDLLISAGITVKALLGPEHGFTSKAGPGEKVRSSTHRKLKIPIHSLYGQNRTPTPTMLSGLDTIIIDIQNLPARPYTYLATMINTMRAAAQHNIEIIIADRPVPLPNTVDGPPLSKGFTSFVAPADLPMAYGMTPGETALWISRYLHISPVLRVARMTGYHREQLPQAGWPAWSKPSPAITSWDAAMCYLTTIACEAIPSLSNCRGESLSFQALTAPWLKADDVCREVSKLRLRGVALHPVPSMSTVLIEVTSPSTFLPVKTGVAILSAIQKTHSAARLWRCKGVRPAFFDQLFGGSSVRLALQKPRSTALISSRWKSSITKFRRQRREVLLYRKKKSS